MSQVVIENPVLNGPFEEPRRHFKFDDEGITDEIIEARRPSSYFVPIPASKKRGRQLVFDTEWTQDRVEENTEINRIRERVGRWRAGGYLGVTRTTRQLLEYWNDPSREKRLFFCQIEAAETAIYIAEVAEKFGDGWIVSRLKAEAENANPLLFRVALKMATGTGKTVVMAMLIAWQSLNKQRNPQDGRFSDTFLIVTPGITIRDRLRVLLPNDAGNYYRQRDVVPSAWMDELGRARIAITNFHAFLRREQTDAPRLTKAVLRPGEDNPFKESPGEMVRRACRDLAGRKNIVVINDEAHHCYRRRAGEPEPALSGDDRREAEKREQDARVWISGLEAVREKLGIRVVYDLSATPFFLRGSGYSENALFPWVVSDFSLIDAIESGIVKVPRVPVGDDSMTGEQPTYRDLWLRIREALPRKGRKTQTYAGEPNLPAALQGALHSLYDNYRKAHDRWLADDAGRADGRTPPVFIVVCSNTNVSKLVFDYIAGWEKELPDGTKVVVPGNLDIFSNEENGRWTARPRTILVDSEQLESGEAMSDDFRRIAATEIEEFKAEYRLRFPGRDSEALTDEDILREVMNTVGKKGKLGENVKCVVSVSMLTEGWDANTVTHILGVRAFGTQLLCEQVVGRGLRRMSYALGVGGRFDPEYAEVYGVPFSFIPCSGSTKDPKPGPAPTHVRALPERIGCEITFPRVVGYRYEIPEGRLSASFDEASRLVLTTQDVPTRTENAPIVGEGSIHTLDDLKVRRMQEVEFALAKLVLERYFEAKSWLFPQILGIARRWIGEQVTCRDQAFTQMLLLHELAHQAADRIYRAIVQASPTEKRLRAILHAFDPVGSTRHVDFDTVRPVYRTRADKCHVSHVVADTESWEQKAAQALEDLDEVLHYVKNSNIGFTIPYTLNGEEHQYHPDFLVRLKNPAGGEPVNLILEVSGEKRKDKEAKVATARTLWVPAVNAHGGFGRWGFLEISDPWDLQNTVRAFLQTQSAWRERFPVEDSRVRDFCRRWRVRKLELFGSVLTAAFRPDSDLDVLVTFEPDAEWSLLDHAGMELELEAILGRKVDLVTRGSIEESENWVRRKAILESAETVYDASGGA